MSKNQFKNARIKREQYLDFIEPKAEVCFVAPTKGVDSGAYGKMREVEQTRRLSLKTGVSAQNQADNKFRLNGRLYPYEYKTNGGRLGKMIKELSRGYDGFIVYELYICNSNTSGKLREVKPIIMHYSQFMQILTETGALRLNSRDNEPCIQPTKKQFYLRLLDYPIEFDKDAEYNSDDFDDLIV